jgi:hypothetical protein
MTTSLPVLQLEEKVAAFLESFRQASATLDIDAQRECFAETFLVGDAAGARPVPREAFLAAIPARAAAAEQAGLGRARLVEASMLRLDESWVLLRTEWSSSSADGGEFPMTSTFLLHDDRSELRITAYLNHRGLPVSGRIADVRDRRSRTV